ncbi:unnamed protein product [Musa textilis]
MRNSSYDSDECSWVLAALACGKFLAVRFPRKRDAAFPGFLLSFVTSCTSDGNSKPSSRSLVAVVGEGFFCRYSFSLVWYSCVKAGGTTFVFSTRRMITALWLKPKWRFSSSSLEYERDDKVEEPCLPVAYGEHRTAKDGRRGRKGGDHGAYRESRSLVVGVSLFTANTFPVLDVFHGQLFPHTNPSVSG